MFTAVQIFPRMTKVNHYTQYLDLLYTLLMENTCKVQTELIPANSGTHTKLKYK